MVSCNSDKPERVIKSEAENIIPDIETSDSANIQANINGAGCDEFSGALIDFIELLKQDNYEITPREDQKELLFQSYNREFQVDKAIEFSKDNFKTILAKRKNKLESMKDNWYPSFSVTEICFEDEQGASESYLKISEIINHFDITNEKNYDYILKNGNRLIYVSCRAMIFSEFAFSYKAKIEEIVKNNES